MIINKRTLTPFRCGDSANIHSPVNLMEDQGFISEEYYLH